MYQIKEVVNATFYSKLSTNCPKIVTWASHILCLKHNPHNLIKAREFQKSQFPNYLVNWEKFASTV